MSAPYNVVHDHRGWIICNDKGAPLSLFPPSPDERLVRDLAKALNDARIRLGSEERPQA